VSYFQRIIFSRFREDNWGWRYERKLRENALAGYRT
jgi:hypothetical protein